LSERAKLCIAHRDLAQHAAHFLRVQDIRVVGALGRPGRLAGEKRARCMIVQGCLLKLASRQDCARM